MLLRCMNSGTFVLHYCQVLYQERLVVMREQLLASSRSRNTSSTLANAADYTLVIPADKCLLTTIPVAKHEVRLLRKTLPWVLEERLLEPAETQHFAIGDIRDDRAAVCVINSSWLASVLTELSSAGITPTAVVPEILLLPWQQGQISVVVQNRAQGDSRV